jgi:hypothetical protein
MASPFADAGYVIRPRPGRHPSIQNIRHLPARNGVACRGTGRDPVADDALTTPAPRPAMSQTT